MGLFEGFFVMGVLSLIAVVLWIYALIDILKNDFKDGLTKVIWLVLVIVLPFLGSILYFFIGRNQKLKND
ncbi:PLD nuclease N-terminal domain-containing protein [Desulfurella sp.]|uniref:PLD nuclease N-terminal domain-containing protein n=1 Tax=Desulfurella sp. TaxID=1962857 RepID=UPI003D138825